MPPVTARDCNGPNKNQIRDISPSSRVSKSCRRRLGYQHGCSQCRRAHREVLGLSLLVGVSTTKKFLHPQKIICGSTSGEGFAILVSGFVSALELRPSTICVICTRFHLMISGACRSYELCIHRNPSTDLYGLGREHRYLSNVCHVAA